MMKQMKILAVFCLTFGFASTSFSVCIGSQADYIAHKSELPAALQRLPVTFTGYPDSTMAMTANFFKGSLSIRYTYKVGIFSQPDTSMGANKICVEGNLVTMGKYKGTLSGNTLKINASGQQFDLKAAAPSAYRKVAQIVSGAGQP